MRRAAARLGVTLELRDIRQDPAHRADLIAILGRPRVPVLRIEDAEGTVWLPESDAIVGWLHRSAGVEPRVGVGAAELLLLGAPWVFLAGGLVVEGPAGVVLLLGAALSLVMQVLGARLSQGRRDERPLGGAPARAGREVLTAVGAAKKIRRARAERRRDEIARRRTKREEELAEEPAPVSLPNWVLLVPSSGGVAVAGYLAGVALLGADPVACGGGSDCALVQGSRFASFLGVPTAAWGLAAYLALALVAWRARSPRWHGTLALLISGTALAVSLYLTAISVFVLRATCIWCLTSLVLVALCFGGSLLPGRGSFATVRRLAGVAAASVLLVGVLHLHYQGFFDPRAGPEAPRLRSLAEHLADGGAIFYGASWCPHCDEQKALFGVSAHRLPYVECAPDGHRAPQAEVCREAEIDTYPTWVVGGRRYEGLLRPRDLAQLSGFDADARASRSPR